MCKSFSEIVAPKPFDCQDLHHLIDSIRILTRQRGNGGNLVSRGFLGSFDGRVLTTFFLTCCGGGTQTKIEDWKFDTRLNNLMVSFFCAAFCGDLCLLQPTSMSSYARFILGVELALLVDEDQTEAFEFWMT
ncbi:hypothetical protein R1flu_009057 [Riccia fluitans]|uniref:Uncharacterized protein n=1 Tax=Riccia fluitans TaxID=41844 RepID=A0ABD1Z185_9MARC